MIRVRFKEPHGTAWIIYDATGWKISGDQGFLNILKSEKCIAVHAAGEWISVEEVESATKDS